MIAQCVVVLTFQINLSVDKECLTSFLKTAQMLRVKGLTEESSTSASSTSVKSNNGINNQLPSAAPSSGGFGISGGRVHSRKSSKPKRSLPFSSTESAIQGGPQLPPIVKKSASLDQDSNPVISRMGTNQMQVIPNNQQLPKTEFNSGNEEEIDDVEDDHEVQEEEINDDEDMLDGNPDEDDEEEEEEMSPMQMNPFLGRIIAPIFFNEIFKDGISTKGR